MTHIDASQLDYRQLNAAIRDCAGDVAVTGCLGQRFIGAGRGHDRLTITGTPGNALGAYLDGACIEVRGDAQDAVGDTMNAGSIIVHGSVGDTAGYAMRGGAIYVQGNAGYRAGVHMKAYQDTLPVMVIGGRTGSFLGEYQAGGLILVLGLHQDGKPIASNFPCTGMHGGKLILRSDCSHLLFPPQVTTHLADEDELQEIRHYVAEYCRLFDQDADAIMDSPFTVVTPDSNNPYKQMYVAN